MKYDLRLIITSILVFLGFGLVSYGQTPFTTDDADVTDKGKYHFELLNEYDLLQASIRPNLRQDITTSRFAYGLSKNVEVGFDAPIVAIFNARGTVPQSAVGPSDASVHIKVKFREEFARKTKNLWCRLYRQPFMSDSQRVVYRNRWAQELLTICSTE